VPVPITDTGREEERKRRKRKEDRIRRGKDSLPMREADLYSMLQVGQRLHPPKRNSLQRCFRKFLLKEELWNLRNHLWKIYCRSVLQFFRNVFAFGIL